MYNCTTSFQILLKIQKSLPCVMSRIMTFSIVQSLSNGWHFMTPCTTACQASLSFNHLLDVGQTHVIQVGYIIQPSHLLLYPYPAFNLFKYQGLFQWVSSLHQVAKILEFQLQHQPFQWILIPLGLTPWISLKSKGLSRVFYNITVQKHQFFGTQLSLWSKSHIHTWLLEKW